MMKNRMERMGAAALVVCMAVSLCACGSSDGEETKEAASAEVDTLQSALEGSARPSHSDENGKETTVYVLTDADGGVDSTIVSEWLKNGDGASTIVDQSTLKDIENTKDDADYTRNPDGTITWNTDGTDVYYRGTASEELPVSVNIKYELDDKEVTADELAGASGHLKMTFTYENHEEKDYIIHGEPCKIYQPYMMVSGTIFDHEKASGVKVDQGKVIDTGDASIVMGVAMPGFRESLNLDELADTADIHIPETVVIEADVTDFFMIAAMTFASNDLLSELGLDEVDSVDDLRDSMEELDDAANQLVDGTGSLADGAGDLDDGTSELKDGSSALADGAEDLDDGAADLADGAAVISEKMKELQTGSKDLSAGVGSIRDGAQLLDSGLTALDDSVSALPGSVETLHTGLGQIKTATDGAKQCADASYTYIQGSQQCVEVADTSVKDAAEKTGKISDAVNAINEIIGQLSDEQKAELSEKFNTIQSAATEVTKDLATADGALKTSSEGNAETLLKEAASYSAGDSTTSASVLSGTASAGLEKVVQQIGTKEQKGSLAYSNALLVESVGQLKSGADQLSAGAKSAADGADQLSSGAGQLADGAATLNSGAKTLKKGTGQLADGAGSLDAGAAKLADGARQLLDGADELKDGMQEFYSEGICELTGLVEDDLLGVYDRLRAVKSFQESQEAYGGCAEGVDCTVKYVYKSGQIGQIDE